MAPPDDDLVWMFLRIDPCEAIESGVLENLIAELYNEPILSLETITLARIGREELRGTLDRLVFKHTRGNTQIVYQN